MTDTLSIFALTAGTAVVHDFPTLGETILYLFGITFFLMLNAFFVASEFAIVKVRPSQLESHGKETGADVSRAVNGTARKHRSLSAMTWVLQADTYGFPLARHNVFF